MGEQFAQWAAARHQGEHLCLIYDDPSGKLAAVAAYVRAGLQRGERCVYIADDRTCEQVVDALVAEGVDVAAERARGAFSLLTKRETYLRSGTFDPQAMIALLREATDEAIAAGFCGLRATGEMTWALGVEPGCDRLIEYEALLNDFFPGSRALGLCQYNLRRFPPATIRDVLRTHPMVVVGDWVCSDNPYYEPIDLVLGTRSEASRLEWMLARLDRVREAEEALRRAAAYNRNLIEASLDPLVTINAAGKLTDVNEATEKVTGCPREELIGTDFSGYFTEPQKAREGYQQVFRLGAVRSYPLEIRHRDGRVTPVRYNASLYRDEAGNVAGVFAAARDVTERKRAEARVAHLNAVLKAIRNVNQLIVREKDPRRLTQRACENLVQTRGYHGAWIALLDDGRATVFASAGLEEHSPELRRGLERGAFPECARRALGSPGVHCVRSPAEDCGSCPLAIAYRDRAGMAVQLAVGRRTIGLLAVSVPAAFADDEEERGLLGEVADDIAFALRGIEVEEERTRAEQALQRASAYNRSLIEASLDPLVTIDATGKITDVNEGTEQVTGRTREELVGTDFSDYFTEPEKAREGYRQVFQLGAVRDYALEIRHRDGHVTPVFYNASVYRDEVGNAAGVFAAARDVTERKRAEEALRSLANELHRLNEELEQRVLARTAELEAANKELEAFSYSVSHDLRAPLRALSGFSRILLEEYAKTLGAEPKHYLEMIHENAQRMGRLVDDLLVFSRLGRQPLKKERVLPAELARQAIADLSSEAAGRQVKITVEELCPCEADPALLEQVFLNLLSNALKFTRHRDVALIEVGCSRDEEPVYFVKDNGVGFDMRYTHKLFGVFQRLHSAEEYEGTGVGLAIVQRIIHRHGGRVWAEGGLDQGATFFFTLPESDRHD